MYRCDDEKCKKHGFFGSYPQKKFSLKQTNFPYKIAISKFNSIANKEAVCFLGGDSMYETVLQLYDNNPEMEKKDVTIISSSSWLKNIHRDWDDQPWGQTKNYLLKYSSLIAKELYPSYPEDKPLKYKMMLDIHRGKEELLKEKHVKIIDNHIDYIVEEKNGLYMVVGKNKQLLVPHNNFYFVHAGREPIGIDECAVQHFGAIYSRGKQDLKGVPLVVVGSGLNLKWAIRDFPERPIIHVILQGDRSLPELHEFLDASLYLANSVIENEEDGTLTIRGQDLKSGKNIVRYVPATEVYSALGFELNKNRVKIDENKVIYIDVAPSVKDINNYSNLKGERSLQTKDMRGTLVPDGNLTLNSLKMFHQLGTKYPLNDAKSVIFMEGWKNAVIQNAKNASITIEPRFFDNLKEVIKHSFSDILPSEEQVWQVIKIIYNKGVSSDLFYGVTKPVARDSNGHGVVWNDFKAMILNPKSAALQIAHKSKQTL